MESKDLVAQWIVQQIRFNISNLKSIGLATGQTMIPIYEEWVRDFKANPYPVDHIHWFLLDELLDLPYGHSDLYETFLEQRLLNPLDIKKSHRHFPQLQQNNIHSANDYELEISKFGGLDLQLLGIGGNGHIGLNEPGTDENLGTHIAQLAKKTQDHHQRFAVDKSLVPAHALTQGLATILKHKSLYLIATGESKSQVMKTFFELKTKTNSFPASLLRDHLDLTVVMDQPAASEVLLNNHFA